MSKKKIESKSQLSLQDLKNQLLGFNMSKKKIESKFFLQCHSRESGNP